MLIILMKRKKGRDPNSYLIFNLLEKTYMYIEGKRSNNNIQIAITYQNKSLLLHSSTSPADHPTLAVSIKGKRLL